MIRPMIVSFIRGLNRETTLKYAKFQFWSQRLNQFASQRQILWGLLLLGMIRSVLMLLAYPPAHGADSYTYFLQAEQLLGNLTAPRLAELAHPLYPYFLVATWKLTGTIWSTIALQALMSASIPAMFYIGLKRYSPLLGMIVAAALLFDVQTAIFFNFTSTEPLYTFLLCAAVVLLLIEMKERQTHWSKLILGLGVLLFFVSVARPVGRFLILPFAFLMLVRNRSIRPFLMLVLGFGITYFAFTTMHQSLNRASDNAPGIESGTAQVARITGRLEFISEENGPNTALYLEVRESCDTDILNCLADAGGSWGNGLDIMIGVALETIRANFNEYSRLFTQNLLNFLGLTSEQYREISPASVHCSDADRVLDSIEENPRNYIWGRYLEEDAYTESGRADLRILITPIINAICPPSPESLFLRSIVDGISGIQNWLIEQSTPLASYPLLALLVIFVGWVRREFLIPVSILGITLLNHAVISAIVFNVQPRYVAVVNSMRFALLIILAYILLKFVIYALDWYLTRQQIDNTDNTVA